MHVLSNCKDVAVNAGQAVPDQLPVCYIDCDVNVIVPRNKTPVTMHAKQRSLYKKLLHSHQSLPTPDTCEATAASRWPLVLGEISCAPGCAAERLSPHCRRVSCWHRYLTASPQAPSSRSTKKLAPLPVCFV
ncbi:hypothetical protein Bpfe_000919 [Biomphalaria pfeifferi]|uniref:Uncharacterized protein n=1 Tax=Biomphalaria pfeifferi TaxID=112525 RepID=A0AAD8CBW8_BIOPF|nr:hypothetical protein Bpfe_000919 [Biomphalaria pfeifferi]